MAVGTEEWRKNAADAHKTTTGGGIRRSMPYNPYAMAAAGLAIVGGLWYYYGQRKPEAGRRTGQ